MLIRDRYALLENNMKEYPKVYDERKVGEYPAVAKAGGGYVWDEVLEYRVWCHPERGAKDAKNGNDYFHAFKKYEDAYEFYLKHEGTEEPLGLNESRLAVVASAPYHRTVIGQQNKKMRLLKFMNKKKNTKEYVCECCGEVYSTIPLHFGAEYPDYYYSVPPSERAERIEMEDSLCVVDGERFFHRGILTIPINDYHENLSFSVWTSISRANFAIRMDLWEGPEKENQKPYFGWLQTNVPTYGNTLNIKTKAYECEVGIVPDIFVFEEGHQLTIDQRDGVNFGKALSIVKYILQKDHGNE